MPDFASRDPAGPEFWSERFQQNFMPWDRGGVPELLRQFVHRSPRPLVTLIPGCGLGHEVAFLAEAGWDVTAIDFSPAAVAAARSALGRHGQRVLEADFFRFDPPRAPDLIYERAFLCALPRSMWPAIAAKWAALLPPGGLLGGFFYFDDTPKGPPFGIGQADLERLLRPAFEPVERMPVGDSIPVFAGKEQWQVWRRLP